MKLSDRLLRLKPHFFSDLDQQIGALQQQGVDLIRLDIGSPDMSPSAEIIQALAKTAAQPGVHGYQPHAGTRPLRTAWERYYRRQHKVLLDPEQQILPLIGSKEGIAHLPLAMINPGDVVLVPDPGYITYTQGALLAGGEVYYLPLKRELNYLPDLGAIPAEVLQRARLLWLNYPNNPTGAVATREFFAAAIAFARQYGLLVCHDAAYSQVVFDDNPALSLLEIPGASEVAVEFNTLSKSHNMAGWRVGVAVGQPGALQALYKLKTNLDSGHFSAIEAAAAAALNGDQIWLGGRNCIYQTRRNKAVAGLQRLGLEVYTPGGGIYVWFQIPPGWTSAAFTRLLVEQAHVSLTPGTVFGDQGEGYLRLALCAPSEKIEAALERIASTQPLWTQPAQVRP